MARNTVAVTQSCSVKKCFFKFPKIGRVTPVLESLKEEIPAQVGSCEFWDICKNIYFIENLRRLLLSIRI